MIVALILSVEAVQSLIAYVYQYLPTLEFIVKVA